MRQKLLLCLLLFSFIGFSQAPQLINYQGAARNSNGTPIINTAIGIRFELRQGSVSSPTVFSEDQAVTTSSLGLFSTQIGKMPGSNFNSVNWQSGSLFLEVSMSLSGGTYTSLGIQQLVSVPYAIYAQSVPASYTNNILTIGANAFTLSPSTGAVYTASTGISITSGSIITNTSPDVPVTFTSSSSNITVNGAYPNFGISYTSTPVPTSLTLNGANNNSLSAGNNTVVLNTYTVGSGLNMAGGPNYTITSTAVSPTIHGAGIITVNPLSGNDFTVSIPNPSITVTNTLLTLTQGTAISTATLNPTLLTLSGTNNNSLSAGNNTVTLNTYTTGAGLSITGGPNYTISSSAASPSIQGAGVVSVNPSSGSSFTVTVPNPSVAVSGGTLLTLSQGTSVSTATLNSYTAGAGISLTGGPNYTINSSAASPSIQGGGVASVNPSSGSSFTVTVPNPSVAVSGGTLLTLSQGTSVSTTTLNSYAAGTGISLTGGPNYTINSAAASPTIQGAGVAAVSPSVGSNFTVTVPNPAVAVAGTLLTLSQGTAVSTATLDSYTAGPGISITSGPNHTVTSLISNPTIQGAGVASVSTSGSNFTVVVPGPSVTIAGTLLTLSQGGSVSTATINPPSLTLSGANNNSLTAGNNTVTLNTYTVGSGLSITGGPDYTIASTASAPSIQGAGVASVSTSGSNYTVTVPNPAITTSGTLLTLTQGTLVSTASLPTTSVTGSGIAIVTGSGLNYNVNVAVPTITATGASVVLGSYPSYTINTATPPTATVVGTGAAVVTPTTGLSYVIDVPLSSVTATNGIATITPVGTNSFNINVPAPSYNAGTGALNTGTATTNITQALTFTNNILTAGPSSNSVTLPAIVNTSIYPAGSASVTGFFPSFTISTPASPTITGTGLAIVSPSTGANITVNVPLLTYTSSSGLLGSGTNTVDITSPLTLNGTTLTSGPASNSINLSGLSPFATSGAIIFQTALTNSVGIGTNAPAAKLDIVESASYTGIHLKVQNVNAANASNMVDLSSNGSGFGLNVFNNNASTTAYAGMFDGGIRTRGKTTNSSGYAIRALDFSSNDLFAVRNDGNVGIGTASPNGNFHVHSTGASILSRITSASAITGLVSYIDGSSAALLNYENTPLYFGTNGANRVVVSATGNVGIGNMSPTAKLDVAGTVKIADGTEGLNKVLTSDAVGNASWQALLPVPSGAIIAYGGTSIPSGWLLCDGSSYLRTTYPALFTAISTAWGAPDGTHFNVPDMRGMFLRGVNGGVTPANGDPDNATRIANNSGGNTGNNVGSEQADMLESHTHPSNTANASLGLGSPVLTGGSGGSNTGSFGGNETRPKNVYVYYIIKQ